MFVIVKWIAMHVVWIVVTYLIGWTVFFTIFAEGNFAYYFNWLELAWTGRGFERPMGAHFMALMFTAFWWIIFSIILFVRRQYSRQAELDRYDIVIP